MKNISKAELEARRSVLLRQLRTVGPLIEGSLATVKRKCGTPGCRCAQGEPHEAVILCRKVLGKSYATYIPRELREEVRSWNDEHKRVKKLLKLVSQINEQIVRLYGAEKRRSAKTKASLRVIDGRNQE
ncbi:MAG: DUF6788 family protein [bacterium]